MERCERPRKTFTPHSRPCESDDSNIEEVIATPWEHSPPTTSTPPAHALPASEANPRVPSTPFEASMSGARQSLNRDPTGQPNTSLFENASNFVMNQPIIGNVQITQNSENPNVLRDMLEYVIPGAEYDSSARDTPPRCHPGTRTRILEEVQTRIHESDMTTRMIWIHGAAGVGKSAIMQTLAEAESSFQTTFTALFFSRPNERDDPKKAFTTLAYGLAVLNSGYRNYIGEKLQDEPTFLGKSMEEQFRRLFITPFLENRVSFGLQRWIVFLDGLDECRGEREQCRIVDLISDSVLCHWASTPFIWIIASRPEAHLKMLFTKAKASMESFWELEVPIDSDESSQDVERYLHAQFSNICESQPDSVPPLWPSEGDFLALAQASSGLFVFASTLVAYLLDGDPVSRLKHILALIERSRAHRSFDLQQNPFRMLDLLYTQIMSDIPKEVLSTTMRLLGFYLLEGILAIRGTPPSLRVASNVLGLEQHTAYAALRKLHSVVACPPLQEAANLPLRFLHASFSDFLCDESRSQAYCIDLNQEVADTWLRCSEILCKFETSRTYNCIDLSWPPQGVRQAVVQKDVVGAALERWMPILLLSTDRISDVYLMIEEPTLVGIFRGLGPSMFIRFRGNVTVPTTKFLDWLNNCAPLKLRKVILRDELPFQSLDKERLTKSLCAYRWCYLMRSDGTSDKQYFENVKLNFDAEFDATQWMEAMDTLWTQPGPLSSLVQAPEHTVSRILGSEPSKYFVVIGPVEIWGLNKLTYYVLPYSSKFST